MVERGNQYWKRRENHGRCRRFETADDLKNACMAYMIDVKEKRNHAKFVFYQGDLEYIATIAHKVPMSLNELYANMMICHRTWQRWRKERPDLKPVIDWIENEIFLYNLAGVKSKDFPLHILNHPFYCKKLAQHEDDMVSKQPIFKKPVTARKLSSRSIA